MKNNEGDYLWDKTGEPDPEIQQLEQVLGTLRYQPRSLDIPAGLAPDYKRTIFPRLLAVAATIALMLLGVGLWLGLQKQQTTEVAKSPEKPAATAGGNQMTVVPPSKDGPDKDNGQTAIVGGNKSFRNGVDRVATSPKLARRQRPTLNSPELAAKEREEGKAAKEQLMIALRVASSKLNFAQKKAQEINSQNQIHNQHKIG